MARKRCPLHFHFAAGGRCCIGCGKPAPIASKNPIKAKKNPRHAKRIGRAAEVRYLRDQGAHQGYYKHVFRRRAAGVWTEPNGTVSIR